MWHRNQTSGLLSVSSNDDHKSDLNFNFQCFSFAYRKDTFTSWLSKLPKLLCQPQISLNTLKTFELLAKMDNAVFMENLRANVDSICSNLTVIRVNGIESQTDGKRMIVNLFFWLKSWTPNSDELPEEERNMIQQIVCIRNL